MQRLSVIKSIKKSEKDGNNLIFIISQPRSGSSLLQQLLLVHNNIISHPEPWLMLNLVHVYKASSARDGYNQFLASTNINTFLNNVPQGNLILKAEIKKVAQKIYSLTNIPPNGYFLDKTPRYYHIIEELYELFPSAKYIFLVRNPISVFASILSYNYKNNYKIMFKQKDRLDDIFLAPANIINARNKYKNNITVCYEDLVNNPPRELNKIFNYLALSSPDNLGEYNLEGLFTKKISIDRKSLGLHSKPKTGYIDSWKTSIETPKIKKLTIDYLNMLGSDSINQLGYSYNELMLSLKQHKPKKRKVALSLSLDLLPKGKSAHNFVSKTINRSKTMFIEILKKVKLW